MLDRFFFSGVKLFARIAGRLTAEIPGINCFRQSKTARHRAILRQQEGGVSLFQIIYSKRAMKFLKKQDKISQKRIVDAIAKLPLEGDIKKMQNTVGYRLRIGSFRIIFDVNGVIIDIIDIGNRGQIYKGV